MTAFTIGQLREMATSMTSEWEYLKDRIFIELDGLCGVCGHCGKRECPERKSRSVLPNQLSRDDVILAIERAFERIMFKEDTESPHENHDQG